MDANKSDTTAPQQGGQQTHQQSSLTPDNILTAGVAAAVAAASVSGVMNRPPAPPTAATGTAPTAHPGGGGIPLHILKNLKAPPSENNGNGSNSDNSALVSIGNGSFGFNFDSEEQSPSNSAEDSDGNEQQQQQRPQQTQNPNNQAQQILNAQLRKSSGITLQSAQGGIGVKREDSGTQASLSAGAAVKAPPQSDSSGASSSAGFKSSISSLTQSSATSGGVAAVPGASLKNETTSKPTVATGASAGAAAAAAAVSSQPAPHDWGEAAASSLRATAVAAVTGAPVSAMPAPPTGAVYGTGLSLPMPQLQLPQQTTGHGTIAAPSPIVSNTVAAGTAQVEGKPPAMGSRKRKASIPSQSSVAAAVAAAAANAGDDSDSNAGGYKSDDEGHLDDKMGAAGGAGGRGKKKRLDDKKREERNEREKQRSFRITKQINELRNLLSSGGVIVPKGTKSSVLNEAANYIRMLQQHQYRSEIDRHQLIQQMQLIGKGTHGAQAAAAVRHVAAQNGVWSLGSFGGVPPKSGMSFYQGNSSSSNTATEANESKSADPTQTQKLDISEYRFVFNSCGVGMAIASMGGAFIDCNHLFCQLSNYTKQEVCALTIFNLTARDDLQHAFDLISQMISPPLEARNQEVKPIMLRGSMKNRDDLGLYISLVKGEDGVAKCFCITLIRNPLSPFDTARPIPVSFDAIQVQGKPDVLGHKNDGGLSNSAPAFTLG